MIMSLKLSNYLEICELRFISLNYTWILDEIPNSHSLKYLKLELVSSSEVWVTIMRPNIFE